MPRCSFPRTLPRACCTDVLILHTEPSPASTTPAATSTHRRSIGAEGGQHDDPTLVVPHHAEDTSLETTTPPSSMMAGAPPKHGHQHHLLQIRPTRCSTEPPLPLEPDLGRLKRQQQPRPTRPARPIAGLEHTCKLAPPPTYCAAILADVGAEPTTAVGAQPKPWQEPARASMPRP
jgi:hypothetical protein